MTSSDVGVHCAVRKAGMQATINGSRAQAASLSLP
jgi:hypothetical protein